MTIWMRHERQLYGNFPLPLLLSHEWRQNWVKLQLVSLNAVSRVSFSPSIATSTCTSACEHLHEHSSMLKWQTSVHTSTRLIVQLLELLSFFVSHNWTSNHFQWPLKKYMEIMLWVMRWNANWEKWKSRNRNRNWRFSNIYAVCLDRVIRITAVNNFPINFIILVPLANADCRSEFFESIPTYDFSIANFFACNKSDVCRGYLFICMIYTTWLAHRNWLVLT